MAYKTLFIFVEGDDDERFFRKIFSLGLSDKYNSLQFVKYSTLKKDKVNSFIKSVASMGSDYIFVGDFDKGPCITRCRENLLNLYNRIELSKVCIVKQEIESWYFSGLNEEQCKRFKIKNKIDCDNLTKELFCELIPKNFTSKISFMQQILEVFDQNFAIEQNSSFNYFWSKYIDN
jgi:hypothetical protein